MPSFSKILFWLCGLIVIVLIFLSILYFFTPLFGSAVKSPIEKQLAAIRMEDPALAYSYTTPAFQETSSFETFKKFINQYKELSNNKKINYQEQTVSDDTAIVVGTLISRGGSETHVRYQLRKINGQWKIESLVLNPEDKNVSVNESANGTRTKQAKSTPTQDQQEEEQQTKQPTSQPVSLTNYFQDSKYGFSMGYPSDWQYLQPVRGVVIFRGMNGTPAYYSSVTLQTVERSKRRSVQQVVDEQKKLIAAKATQMSVIDDGIIPAIQASSEGYQARYIVYSYTINNVDYGALQVLYYKDPGRVLYVFDYVSPAAQFEADLHAAKLMADSFGGR